MIDNPVFIWTKTEQIHIHRDRERAKERKQREVSACKIELSEWEQLIVWMGEVIVSDSWISSLVTLVSFSKNQYDLYSGFPMQRSVFTILLLFFIENEVELEKMTRWLVPNSICIETKLNFSFQSLCSLVSPETSTNVTIVTSA